MSLFRGILYAIVPSVLLWAVVFGVTEMVFGHSRRILETVARLGHPSINLF